jgi:hypothetical protein
VKFGIRSPHITCCLKFGSGKAVTVLRENSVTLTSVQWQGATLWQQRTQHLCLVVLYVICISKCTLRTAGALFERLFGPMSVPEATFKMRAQVARWSASLRFVGQGSQKVEGQDTWCAIKVKARAGKWPRRGLGYYAWVSFEDRGTLQHLTHRPVVHWEGCTKPKSKVSNVVIRF